MITIVVDEINRANYLPCLEALLAWRRIIVMMGNPWKIFSRRSIHR